ncbi:MAG: hypothetical protein ACI9XO_003655 [Paraglaciecola sp.]|jgi:hypothetical protein
MFTKAISRYIQTNYPINQEGLNEIIEGAPESIKSELMMLGERLLKDGEAIGANIERKNRGIEKRMEQIENIFAENTVFIYVVSKMRGERYCGVCGYSFDRSGETLE